MKKLKVIRAEGFFPSESRWNFYRYWYTPNKKGDILAIHGAAEHSGRYQELGSIFAQNGYNFYILDLTGHGRSEGKRGYINYYQDYIVDIANFYSFLYVHKKMEKPFIFGHSMGGLLASLFVSLEYYPIKGMVLSSPFFKLKMPVPFFKKFAAKLVSKIYPTLAFENEIKAEWLTHDKYILEDYIIDPFITKKVTAKWFIEILKALKAAENAPSHINVPSLIFHGEDDKLCDIQGTKNFFAKITGKEKELYIVKKAYHEVFNEVGREHLIKKMLIWLDKKNV